MTNAWNTQPGNARNGQTGFISTWITDEYEYAILVRHDWHPIVCKRTRDPIGSWQTHDVIGTVIDIIEVSDSHQGISIAVDADGYIHVAGNTHGTQRRHIVSASPHDITSWVTAPPIEKQAYDFTNLVENGVVENNTDGWSSVLPSRYTLDRVTHAYGWGSSHGNDTDCNALRLTRTADTPSTTIGQGQIYSINDANGFTATPGQSYSFSLSMRCATNVGATRYSIWLIFRSATDEILRVSASLDAANATLWYRPHIPPTVAPEGTLHVQMEFSAVKLSGNAATGDAMWADGAMLIPGSVETGDIVYRDGSFVGGYEYTGWQWTGAPYASSSTGPIRTSGYAGLKELGYQRFQRFSDGTIILSGSQPVYPRNPVGRAWSIWKKEAGQTTFHPLKDGSDGIVMRNTMSTLLQGSAYPVLSTGNPPNDATIADRAYAYGTYIDKQDTLHMFCWFRVETDTSYGDLLYVRSYDKGQTWQNIHGDPVSMPLTYPDSLETTLVSVDGTTAITCSTTSGICEQDGNPILIAQEINGAGHRLIYWDGASWQNESIGSYGYNAGPSVCVIRGDIWLFGSKAVFGKGNRALWGTNHTKGTDLIVRLGAINLGTPDGVYQFESGSTYETAPAHAGGLDSRNNYIFKRLIPDGDQPKIVQFGEGPRFQIDD